MAESGGRWSSVADPGDTWTLDVLISDFVRVLGCEMALLCELDGDRGPQVVCASGIDSPVAITISRRGGARRLASRLKAGGCFVGRALGGERPVFETLDPVGDAELRAAFAR